MKRFIVVPLKWTLLFALIAGICWCPAALSEDDPDGSRSARQFVTEFSKSWTIEELTSWASPSFNSEIAKNSKSLDPMFKGIGQKLGALKCIRSINLMSPHESNRAMYLADIDYDKGPAKMKLEMERIGNDWKVKQIGMDSKLLNVAPPSQATLTRLQQYVDTVIPRLGRKWDFSEFKTEADPRMFQSNELIMKSIFSNMTGLVGPIISYQKSELVATGYKNGAPMGNYKAYFTGRNGEGMAIITVCLQGDKSVITDFNIAKKMVRR